MTGISQTPGLPPILSRPAEGRVTYAAEEALIQEMLKAAKVEEEVEFMWTQKTPEQIAQTIRHRYAHGVHGFKWITARWVEGIKRRIDNRKRDT